jgi:hypothetical protein
LIHHLGEQTLDVAWLGERLGWLLSAGYAPVQRLVDGLNLVRDASPRHNKGLVLLLTYLLGEFARTDEPPRSTRKLLETYLDLLVKLRERPADHLRPWLRTCQSIPALKAVCAALLKR